VTFEWDTEKALANIEKHGIDFVDVIDMWDRPVVDPAGERFVGDEYRPTALGTIGPDDLIVAVVYTARDGAIRLISARRARRHERQDYQNRFRRGS